MKNNNKMSDDGSSFILCTPVVLVTVTTDLEMLADVSTGYMKRGVEWNLHAAMTMQLSEKAQFGLICILQKLQPIAPIH